MLKKLSAISAIVYLSVYFVAAQTPMVQSSPATEQDEVVKISTNLVQVDAVVIDKDGKQITNLKADDFEIFQDSKPQNITQFSYISTAPRSNPNNVQNNTINQAQTFLSPNGFGRVLTFIVDDGNCIASQIGITATREGLTKFINEQMMPNDLVAIYQTRTGSLLNQQYTSDKNQLRRIVNNIKWSPDTVCGSRVGDLFEREKADFTVKATGTGKKSFESPADLEARENFEDNIRENNALNTIETLRFVTSRLKNVGGRKIIFFLSDGLPLVGRNNRIFRSNELLGTLIAEANQSSIVFNSIDIRGLFNASMLQANDDVLVEQPNVAKPTSTDKAIINRINDAQNSQSGLAVLANETGGIFSRGTNFLDNSIRDTLNREKGFYLLGYQPNDETFKGKKYHKIEIRLKGTDLTVLSRSGFSVKNVENTKEKSRNEKGEIIEALSSPLPLTGLKLRLDGFFSNSPTEGNFIFSFLRLNGREITFVDDEKGLKKAVLEITVVLLDEKGKITNSFSRSHILLVAPQDVAVIQEKGIILPLRVPVKSVGIFNLRVAVRDASSRQIGSAGEIVEVPDLQKGDLFLSTVALAAFDQNGNPISAAAVKTENGTATIESLIPNFRRGTNIAFVYTLYNVQIDKTSKKPNLTVQTELYQNGKIVSETKPKAVELEQKTDWRRIDSSDFLQSVGNMAIGNYSLRVVINDLTSGKKVEYWAEFDLIN